VPSEPSEPREPSVIDPEPPGRRVSLALAPALTSGPSPAGQPGRRSRKLGDKKIVLDYSTPATEVAMPGLVAQPTEDPAIGLARTAYLSGNQQLFAGDAQGAIRAYRESLSLYPGYVGGYRGLGLAYAQLGDHRNALEAFKMYVDTVPTARDVALIKKRIARLQGK
jgi:tetratricopeptide (TPR) repeat protein